MITYQKSIFSKVVLHTFFFYKQCLSKLHALDLAFSAMQGLFKRILEYSKSEVHNLDSFDKYFEKIVN